MKLFTAYKIAYKPAISLFLIFLALVLLFTGTPLSASADGTKEMNIGDFNVTYWPMDYYAAGWEGVTINSYIGNSSHVTFPKKLGGYDVLYGINTIDPLPDFVTSIKWENNVSIQYFDLPKNLSSLSLPDERIYSDFYGLEDTPYYKNKNNWVNGMLYCGKHLLAIDKNHAGQLVIPNGTIDIEYTALENMPKVTSVVFPGSLKEFSYEGKDAPGIGGAMLKELIFCEGMQDVAIHIAGSQAPIEKIVLPDSLKTVYLSRHSSQNPAIYCSTGNTTAIKCAQENKLSLVYKQREAVLKSSVNVNITVKYSNNSLFDIGTSFISQLLDFSKLNEKIRTQISSNKVTAYDLSLEIWGNKIQPTGKVTVSLPVPTGYNSSQIVVYHVYSNSELGKVSAVIKNGVISFETDGFSPFLIVEQPAKIGTTASTSKAPTSASGDSTLTTTATSAETSMQTNSSTATEVTVSPDDTAVSSGDAVNKSEEARSPSLMWLWIALTILLVGAGAGTVLFLIKSGKIHTK